MSESAGGPDASHRAAPYAPGFYDGCQDERHLRLIMAERRRQPVRLTSPSQHRFPRASNSPNIYHSLNWATLVPHMGLELLPSYVALRNAASGVPRRQDSLDKASMPLRDSDLHGKGSLVLLHCRSWSYSRCSGLLLSSP